MFPADERKIIMPAVILCPIRRVHFNHKQQTTENIQLLISVNIVNKVVQYLSDITFLNMQDNKTFHNFSESRYK